MRVKAQIRSAKSSIPFVQLEFLLVLEVSAEMRIGHECLHVDAAVLQYRQENIVHIASCLLHLAH